MLEMKKEINKLLEKNGIDKITNRKMSYYKRKITFSKTNEYLKPHEMDYVKLGEYGKLYDDMKNNFSLFICVEINENKEIIYFDKLDDITNQLKYLKED